MRLIDVVSNISEFDDNLTIYVEEPWNCESYVVIEEESESGDLPEKIKNKNMSYFLEVFIAKEFLEDYVSSQKKFSAIDQCERLILYAIRDA